LYHSQAPEVIPDYSFNDRLPTAETVSSNSEIPVGAIFTEQFSTDTLAYDPSAANGWTFQWKKQDGTIVDFNANGQFLSSSSPQSYHTTVAVWSGNQLEYLAETYNGDEGLIPGAGDQRVAYAYLGSGVNEGELAGASLENAVYNSATGNYTWQVVQQVSYAYYDGSSDTLNGGAGDLESATIETASGQAIDTTYYRYYVQGDPDTNGYPGGLKFIFGPSSYARLLTAAAANEGTPSSEPESFVAAYADHYYQYNSAQQVTLQRINGFGSSSAASNTGQGTFTYTYTVLYPSTSGPNVAVEETVETLPDGSTNTVDCDSFGLALSVTTNDAVTHTSTETLIQYNQSVWSRGIPIMR
jgi:hypothetical protein